MRHPSIRWALLGWGWLSVAAIAVGFWLPWVEITWQESSWLRAAVDSVGESNGVTDTLNAVFRGMGRIAVKVKHGTEQVVGDLPSFDELPRQLSGVEIPRFANRPSTKAILAVAGLLTDQAKDADVQSYAVYLVPGVAFLLVLIVTVLGRRFLFVTQAAAILVTVIVGVGFWKLLTMDMKTPLAAITIGQGLWFSLWGYLSLAVAFWGYGWICSGKQTSPS